MWKVSKLWDFVDEFSDNWVEVYVLVPKLIHQNVSLLNGGCLAMAEGVPSGAVEGAVVQQSQESLRKAS